LTIYELRESEAVEKQEWVGMDEDMLRRCLDVLVKKGRAQVFGQADGSGVKFF
jgi:ESCRT-II complex subunit VPS25